MTRAPVIARRELSSYFYSPIAYVAMFLFLIVAGYMFREDFQPGQPAAMRVTFEWMVWLLVLVLPMLCMGLLAQEWASGTIETMMTAPVSESDLVLGKFAGLSFSTWFCLRRLWSFRSCSPFTPGLISDRLSVDTWD